MPKRLKEESVETRVYQYGLVPMGPFPQEGVDELFRANQLRNKLVDLHNKNREEYENARCAVHKSYRKITQELKELEIQISQAYDERNIARMKEKSKDGRKPLIQLADDKIKILKQQRGDLWAQAKEPRKEADKLIDKKAIADRFRLAVNEATRVEQSGVGANTAGAIRDYFKTSRDRAFKENATLRFHRFDGSGFFHFRFRRKGKNVDGVSCEDLFDPKKLSSQALNFLSQDNTRSKPRIRIKAMVRPSKKKEKQASAEFDLVLHRPLPPGAQIQNAKITRRRIGGRFYYEIALTIRTAPKPSREVNLQRAIGLDIGFRKKDKGFRVAALCEVSSGTVGSPEFIEVPHAFVEQMAYLDELKTTLDQQATDLGTVILPMIKGHLKSHPLPEEHAAYRFYSKLGSYPSHITLSFETAIKLGGFIHRNPGLLSEHTERLVAEWNHRWRPTFNELHNLRIKSFRSRKHVYRQIAIDLVRRRVPIGVEIIDLSTFADTTEGSRLSAGARSQRFLVAPSELLGTIKNAAHREGVPVFEVPAANTSKRCSACGKVNKKLGAESEWICPSCDTHHDRDHNAAINIARLTLEKMQKSD